MRISGEWDDPDYVGSRRYRVWLDDEEIRYALVADDVAGTVVRYVEHDEPPRFRFAGGVPVDELLVGRVRIERIA